MLARERLVLVAFDLEVAASAEVVPDAALDDDDSDWEL